MPVVSVLIVRARGAMALALLLASCVSLPARAAKASALIEAQPSSSPGAAGPGDEPSERCSGLAFATRPSPGRHPAAPDDLMRLRDFGSVALDPAAASGFDLSPDRRHIAVQVRQAEPVTNRYCQALLIFDLRAPGLPIVTHRIGGDLPRSTSTLYGMNGFPSGTPRELAPQWSPNGRWIAYITRISGFDALHVASSDGRSSVPIAKPQANVQQFAWEADSLGIRFETDEPLQHAQAMLDAQGRDGYRYDERFWMLSGTRPHPRGVREVARYRVGLGPPGTQRIPQPWTGSLAEQGAERAWIATEPEPAFAYRTTLHVLLAGREVTCAYDQCADAEAAWLVPGSHDVVFVRREGFARSRTAVYRWRVAQGAPRRLGSSEDALTGCMLAGPRLYCGRETSMRPRDIVAIDLDRYRLGQVVDLNPEWAAIAPVRVERLHWVNAFGIPAIGDLVIPSSIAPGRKLPLVVVQYDTRGFLRGGVGDEYPIRPLAAAGFAVLSVSRPMDVNMHEARAGQPVDQRALMEDWTDRASVHDSLLRGIEAARQRASLDDTHLAITGLSDGASTATYALIHSRAFSLALLSTCCEDPAVTTTAIGPAYEAFQSAYDYPLPWKAHENSWRKMSVAMNASAICAEIQMQVADSEARMALTSLSALRQAGVPAQMFVFPGEYHFKWQPAHRLAIYRRNIETLLDWRSRSPWTCPRDK